MESTRNPYSSVVGGARPERSARKISMAADPNQVPSLSKNKATQKPHDTCLPVLSALTLNEAVPPRLDSNAMAPLHTSIPPDAAIFPSPPLTPDNIDLPSSIDPYVTFNIPNTATVPSTRAMPPSGMFQYSEPRHQKQTSVASRTTVGGCTFEDLCNGALNYVCDPSCLVDLSKTDAVDEVVRLLAEKLEDNLRELEIARDGKVTKIYIGKTFIRQRRKGGGGFQQLNRMQPTTWKKDGISSRWSYHKTKGKDGLIVLTAVTRKIVPNCTARFNQEDYVLMLEQRLIQHYKLKNDIRLENENFREGARTQSLAYGYALYVAFIIEENDEDISIFTDDDTDDDDHDSNESTIASPLTPTDDHDDNPLLTNIDTYQPPNTSDLPSNVTSDSNESTIASPLTPFTHLDHSLHSEENKSDTECEDCNNRAPIHTLGNVLLVAFMVTLIGLAYVRYR